MLASHEGTTMQAVMDAHAAGILNASIALVVSNNSTSGAMHRAEQAGIPTLHISGKTHASPEDQDTALADELAAHDIDYVLLLGYMKKLGPMTIARFSGRILNTHPALLPKFGGKGFYGRKVHEAVLASGDTVTGATIHLVGTEYDTGPLLAQVRVPVKPGDSAASLETRVKNAERKLLVNTLIELTRPLEVSNY